MEDDEKYEDIELCELESEDRLKKPVIASQSGRWKWLAVGAFLIFLFLQIFDVDVSLKPRFSYRSNGVQTTDNENIVSAQNNLFLQDGVTLPIRWRGLGRSMVESGVIDEAKFENLYRERGGLDTEMKQILTSADEVPITMTKDNAQFLLNMLWALGLGTKNDILESGPMMTYSGAGSPAEALAKAGNFASTGGWTLARGDPMDHYSRHPFVVLTSEQQELVERVSKNIYRPCCNNPTHFPDCNHGMAMLGLLELMASEGVSEAEIYRIALQVNSYWFPDTYITIAKYLESKGASLNDADPKELLGYNFSSAAGYRQIRNIYPQSQKSNGGCGV